MEGILSGPAEPLPVIPLVSIISADDGCRRDAGSELADLFGDVLLTSPSYPFDLSDYYHDEMGSGLFRVWLAFETLRDPSLLAAWKHDCLRIEEFFRDGGEGRKVNLDPGYMDYGKLVLASFKEAPDKVYIGRGVWAHTCLRYGHGTFTAPDHSFPDFRDGRFNGFMKDVRNGYRRLLRSAGE